MINESACIVVIYHLQQGVHKYVSTIQQGSTFTFTSYKNNIFSVHPLNEPLKKQYYFIEECDEEIFNIYLPSCKEEEYCLENSIEENEVNTIYRVNVFNQITASNIILEDALAEYKAGKKIILKPGFKALKGSYFNARIDKVCDEYGNIEEDDNILKSNQKGLLLYQIYPNPTNDFFTLKYQLTQKATLHIALHNAAGKKLNTITKANQEAGMYELPYNIQHQSAGIYYLTVSTPDLVNTQKLIIHR